MCCFPLLSALVAYLGSAPQEDAVTRLESSPFRNEAPVVSGILSPDAKTLIAADSSGCVIGWDRNTLQRRYRRQIARAGQGRRRLTASADGRWISLSMSDPPTVYVFGTLSGDEVCRLDGCPGAAFSRDGSLLAGWRGRTLRLWDLAEGRELALLEKSDSDLIEAGFSPDGSRLFAAVSGTPAPVIWDRKTLRIVYRPGPDPTQPGALGLAISPDGKTIAVGDAWGATLWKVESIGVGTSSRLDAYGEPPLRFTPDGKSLIGTQNQRRIGLWSLTGGGDEQWGIPSNVPGFMELADTGDLLIQGSDHRIMIEPLRLHPLERGTLREDSLTGVGFAPDGRAITFGADGRVGSWEVPAGDEVKGLEGPPLPLLALSRDGTRAAFGSAGKAVHLWDLSRPGERARIDGLSYITSADWTPDGKEVVAGTERGFITFWNVEANRERLRVRTRGVGVTAIRCSPDGAQIAWGEGSGDVVFADRVKGTEEVRYRARGAAITTLAYWADGRSVVTGDRAGSLLRWDDALGREPLLIGRQKHRITALAITPDGRWIASGDSEGNLTLWPPEGDGGVNTYSYTSQGRGITSLAFSPDGKLLVSATGQEAAIVWKVPERR